MSTTTDTLKILFALAVLVLIGWSGASNLIQWFSTGEVWITLGGRGEPKHHKLISFDDDPVNLVGHLIVATTCVAVSCGLLLAFARRVYVIPKKIRSEKAAQASSRQAD